MKVDIPIHPDNFLEFMSWVEHLELKGQANKDKTYVTVEYENPIDLYWLAANYCGTVPTSNLSRHGLPDHRFYR
jgi:hypothetical protein